MALQYSPKIINDGLIMCLDASQNTSLPTIDLPIKGGLLLWLDAADDSTFSYSSGTEVSQWRDKSGNNFHANQSTTAQQPSRSNVVNSRKTVNFVAANGDFIRVSSGIVTPNYITVFAVIKPATQSNSYAVILEQDHGNGYNGWVIQRNNNVSQWQSWVSSNATSWLNPTYVGYTDNTPQIVTLRKNSSTINLYSNATSNGAGSISDTAITQSSYGINLGYWQYGGGRYYNGEICEILVYNRGLSDVELNRVNTYLGLKWNISNADRSIIDVSGNNNHGLLGNGTTANMPAVDYYNKNCLRFDGSNDYLYVPSPGNFSNYTFMFWCRWISNTTNGGRIFGVDNFGTFTVFTPTNVAFHYNQAAGTSTVLSSGINVGYDTWCHVAVTVDGVNAKIYINGGLTNATTSIPYVNVSGNFFIGGQSSSSSVISNSTIGTFQFYSRALSASEILNNYNAQKSRFDNTIIQQGLVLNLDAGNPYSYAGAGTTWYDVSGNSNNGTLTNTPIFSSDNSGIFNFNGTSQFVDCGNVLASLTNLTLECFVKFGTQSTSYNGIISKTLNNTDGWELRTAGYTSTTTDLQFRYKGDAAAAGFASSFTNGVWYHIVATGTSGSQITYVNGVQSSSNNIGTTPTANSNSLLISKLAYSGLYTNMTMGFARIYNVALSAAQVLQNYNATKGRFGL